MTHSFNGETELNETMLGAGKYLYMNDYILYY